MPRYSAAQLTSAKILAQRSAVPAVFSRTTTTTSKRKHGLSREDKDRLRRIAKRPRKGPFNSIMDQKGPYNSIKDPNSGIYDPWVTQPVNEVKDGLETVQKKKIKVFTNSSFHMHCLTYPILASHLFYISQET